MNAPRSTDKTAWYLKKPWWIAGTVLLVAIAALAVAGNSGTHNVGTSGRTATVSTVVPTSTTPTAPGEDDTAASGAPTIAGGVVAPGSGRSSGAAACRTGSPLANVYHPNRLSVVSGCMTVSGTVETVRSESDGDTHFDLALDAPFTKLLKPANYSDQKGWLVAEIVPADKPGCTPGQPPRPASGSYDYGVCTGADETVPSVGEHVYVTGPYVIDDDHGGWAEIHPVWAVATQAPSSPSPAGGSHAPAPTQSAAPSPATSGVRITSVTSPVSRGSTASLEAHAAPDTQCSLAVTLPSGAQSRSQGLGPATADPSGDLRWTWETGTRTAPGTATATVTCGTASDSAQFQITA